MTDLRSLPSVDQLLQEDAVRAHIASYGRPLTLEAVRRGLDDGRVHFKQTGEVPELGELLQMVASFLDAWTAPTLKPVINATGVLIHTNLGRAPLSEAALKAVADAARGYSNLEYDLQAGWRGSRAVHAGALIKRLTGAEAAFVVNNNAAAVLLVLSALAGSRRVLISRTQLIEIGGGFRIPDVMVQSGAVLHEIGTTNRVHLTDYQRALADQHPQVPFALVLAAHWSNFRIIGFTSEPPKSEIAAVAHASGLPFVEDLGSGTLLDTAPYGLEHEPTVQESLENGADLVTFSGDKLLGGPQAGIIAGRADLVAKIKRHPLARALRPDKLCLAALSATLLHYLKDEAQETIPLWRMIAADPESIRSRALAWSESLGSGEVVAGESAVGGGSLPGEVLPTYLLALSPSSPDRLLARLRRAETPIVARVQDDRVLFDPRSVLPEHDRSLVASLRNLVQGS